MKGELYTDRELYKEFHEIEVYFDKNEKIELEFNIIIENKNGNDLKLIECIIKILNTSYWYKISIYENLYSRKRVIQYIEKILEDHEKYYGRGAIKI